VPLCILDIAKLQLVFCIFQCECESRYELPEQRLRRASFQSSGCAERVSGAAVALRAPLHLLPIEKKWLSSALRSVFVGCVM
jgi:hypothetical protein